jgi:hypothetical protein
MIMECGVADLAPFTAERGTAVLCPRQTRESPGPNDPGLSSTLLRG